MTASPTCVVTFDDGAGKADLERGIKLARFAYESRCKRFPPAIRAVHFEAADGVELIPYTADEIARACK